MVLEIGQKPVLVQVVRLGQPTGKCRPVRVSLKGPDTVHSILKGGGQTFFRAFINSELGLPEVAP